MSTAHRLLILHLSDLHFGLKSRFGDEDYTKLGQHFCDQTSQAIKHLPNRWDINAGWIPKVPDLVVVTGDTLQALELFAGSCNSDIKIFEFVFFFICRLPIEPTGNPASICVPS